MFSGSCSTWMVHVRQTQQFDDDFQEESVIVVYKNVVEEVNLKKLRKKEKKDRMAVNFGCILFNECVGKFLKDFLKRKRQGLLVFLEKR